MESYIPFVFMKIIFLLHTFKNIIFFIKSKYKGDNSIKKRKGNSPLKHSGVQIVHVLIQIILLHGFDACVSIVRLNRYVIKSIPLPPVKSFHSLSYLTSYRIGGVFSNNIKSRDMCWFFGLFSWRVTLNLSIT